MNEYLFFTSEGQTVAPNGDAEIENCQILGRAKGKNALEARENLLADNEWISEAHFNPAKFWSVQVLTEAQRADIQALAKWVLHDGQGTNSEGTAILQVAQRLQMI